MTVSRLARTPRALRIVEARSLSVCASPASADSQEGLRSAQGNRRCVLPAPSSLRLSTSVWDRSYETPVAGAFSDSPPTLLMHYAPIGSRLTHEQRLILD